MSHCDDLASEGHISNDGPIGAQEARDPACAAVCCLMQPGRRHGGGEGRVGAW